MVIKPLRERPSIVQVSCRPSSFDGGFDHLPHLLPTEDVWGVVGDLATHELVVGILLRRKDSGDPSPYTLLTLRLGVGD